MIWLSAFLIGVISLLVAALRTWQLPRASGMSRFELKRRAEAGDKEAQRMQRYERRKAELAGGIWLAQAGAILALTIIVVMFVQPFILAVAIVIGMIAASAVLAHLTPVARIGQYFREKALHYFFVGSERFAWVRILLYTPPQRASAVSGVHSKQELDHIVQHLGKNIVSAKQKTLLMQSLVFDEYTLKDCMIPRSKLATIGADDILGPLVVNELHQTGQQWFLVVGETPETVLGVIHLHQLTDVRGGHTQKASEMMQRDIDRMPISQQARSALNDMVAHYTSMVIVTGETGTVAGVVTIGDIVKLLFDERHNESWQL